MTAGITVFPMKTDTATYKPTAAYMQYNITFANISVSALSDSAK